MEEKSRGRSLLAVSVAGIGLAINWNVAFRLLPLTISDAVLSYDLAVVPMFILMGNVISRTGIARDLFKAAYGFVGHVRGGLALSAMVACSGFSAVCGSSYATAATMAWVAYRSMRKYKYSDELAAGTIAAGGTLAILIPPSIIMVVYGILTQTNLGDLFIAGVVPGLLGLAFHMLAIRVVAALNPAHPPQGERTPWPERIRTLTGVWPFLPLFGLIIGGLYAKLFTPTEAAGIGAGLAILIATFQGKLNWMFCAPAPAAQPADRARQTPGMVNLRMPHPQAAARCPRPLWCQRRNGVPGPRGRDRDGQ